MEVNKLEVKKIIDELKDARLVAATKYVGIEEINKLEELGVKYFGENRVQALLEKYEKYDGNCEFHMIGTLQANKVKYIIDKVSLIHSVDSYSLINEIEKQKLSVAPRKQMSTSPAGRKLHGKWPSSLSLSFLLSSLYLFTKLRLPLNLPS